MEFSLAVYMRIHESLQFYVAKHATRPAAPAVSMDFFLKTFEKGSRSFRNVLVQNNIKGLKIENLNSVQTFFSLMEVPTVNESLLRKLWGAWSKSGLGNRTREFLFKFFNNRLGLNARVYHFVENIQAECSLCIAGDEPAPIQSETFVHLFYNCSFTEKYRKAVIEQCAPFLANAGIREKKEFWFLGAINTDMGPTINFFIASCVFSANFMIWQMKLQKNLVPVSVFLENLKFEIDRMLKRSKFLREEKESPDNISLF
jgi:hypothetical protein